MNHLLIRSDASTTIGNGHVMRCLALAQAWPNADSQVTFAMALTAPAIEARLKAEGIRVLQLTVDTGSADDAQQTVALAGECDAAFVVADGYQFGADYQRRIKAGGMPLMLIDDYGHAEHYFADIVLNQNPNADEGLYKQREPYTRLLLGTRYVLLHPRFLKYRDWQRPIPATARKVLVTLGGSDPDNVTSTVIKALATLDVSTKVVVGSSNPRVESLRAAMGQLRHEDELIIDTNNMPELMGWADVAISGGGSTCWEMAFMGLPMVTMILAENQRAAANTMAEKGISICLGDGVNCNSHTISQALTKLLADYDKRREMSKKGKVAVNGTGTFEVIKHLLPSDGGKA